MAKHHVAASRSATRCLLSLACMGAIGFCLALMLPSVREAVRPWPYQDPRNTVMIVRQGFAGVPGPLVPMSAYRDWKELDQHVFSEFAFVDPASRRIHLGHRRTPELSIALASANVFRVLGASVDYSRPDAPGSRLPVLILSETAWHELFSGSPEIFGRILQVGAGEARVGGVVRDRVLPGAKRFDAWLLLPPSSATSIPATANIYVAARLTSPLGGTGDPWLMSAPGASGQSIRFDCIALSASEPDTLGTFIFIALVALLALPATTSLPLGEYPARGASLSHGVSVRRWVFLLAKVSLLLPALYFCSVDLAYARSWSSPYAPQYIQIVSSFCATLFALRWALHDQRQRCPVCLAKLTNPARVGQPSRNFLGWNGTELICAGGHGLLHVPELPTSWFSTQRWLYLDASWSVLFLHPA